MMPPAYLPLAIFAGVMVIEPATGLFITTKKLPSII